MKYLIIIRHHAFGRIFADLANLCKSETKVFPGHKIIHKDNFIDVLIVESDDISAACEQLKTEMQIGFDLEVYEIKEINV